MLRLLLLVLSLFLSLFRYAVNNTRCDLYSFLSFRFKKKFHFVRWLLDFLNFSTLLIRFRFDLNISERNFWLFTLLDGNPTLDLCSFRWVTNFRHKLDAVWKCNCSLLCVVTVFPYSKCKNFWNLSGCSFVD